MHAGSSEELFHRACASIPGGVNSVARGRLAGWDPYPPFVLEARGAHLTDVEGNRYIDYLLALGPMMLGHRHPAVTRAVRAFIEERGTMFALPCAEEARVAERLVAMIPSLEQVRFCNTGTEAVLHALRLARAHTGRPHVLRFEGMYHGFAPAVYDDEHSDPPPGALVLPWNDREALEDLLARRGGEIAAVITEPVMCNCGCILPDPGYLEALAAAARRAGALVIYDEVITGFRLGAAGAQGMFGQRPDLSIFAKALGGGFPMAAIGGRADVMRLADTPQAPIGGTYSANGIGLAATEAALAIYARPGAYDTVFRLTEELRDGLQRLFDEAGLAASVVSIGAVLQVWFADRTIRDARTAHTHVDGDRYRQWWRLMKESGVLFHPDFKEPNLLSFAHTGENVARTLEVAYAAIGHLKRQGRR